MFVSGTNADYAFVEQDSSSPQADVHVGLKSGSWRTRADLEVCSTDAVWTYTGAAACALSMAACPFTGAPENAAITCASTSFLWLGQPAASRNR